MSVIEDLVIYWQPLSGLAIGIVILVFVGYINWYGTSKGHTIDWIAKAVFRNGFRSRQAADGLFMVVMSLLLAVSSIMVVTALLYLGVL